MSEVGEIEKPEAAKKVQRTRKRNTVSADQRKEIASRVIKFYNDEKMQRDRGRAARLQRYAKYRLWTEGTDWPWPDASDSAVPDMLQDSLRVQDTLHNAVMSQKPPVIANATKEQDAKKEKTVNKLLQHQVFVEQPGESIIGEMAEAFTNDPSLNVFVPWVREKKKVGDVEIFDGIPEDADPKGYFLSVIKEKFGADLVSADSSDMGWDWEIELKDGDELDVCFYTNEVGEVEMVTEREAIVYNGPRIMVKDYDDVLYPARSANLQPPGPSNPRGASYVVLRDFPTVSEIASLQASKYYDLITAEDMKEMRATASSANFEAESEQQKDKLAGTQEQPGQPQDSSHKKLTRLICFDLFDIDGDGIAEDCVFWVIKETQTILRVRRLSDVSPGAPPRRPLFGGCFLPVQGRHDGMSLLEIMEPLHDAVKVIVDQGINANDLAIASPGYYRPSGGMNPEVLRIEPFTLSPLQNPQQDVIFPQMGNPNAMGFSLNMLNMLGMWQDKTTMVGDLQFGNIPTGGSSALRTIGGMSLAMGQSEARPERILRRFFSILTDIYAHMHRLNREYLPKNKQFRVVGFVQPGEDPYVKIEDFGKEAGEFDFSFDANAFNTSKQALQQSLTTLMKVIVNPLALQLGITDPGLVYNLIGDFVAAYGQPQNRYIKPPTPEAGQPRILAEEAITEIMRNQLPIGAPLEAGGVQEHMQKLVDFASSPNFGLLPPHQVDLFKQYLLKLQEALAADAQKQQMMQHAGNFAQNMNQQGPGAPVQNAPQLPSRPPPVSGANELQDERMPTAGGGANGA
jgi:hypothetical protein